MGSTRKRARGSRKKKGSGYPREGSGYRILPLFTMRKNYNERKGRNPLSDTTYLLKRYGYCIPKRNEKSLFYLIVKRDSVKRFSVKASVKASVEDSPFRGKGFRGKGFRTTKKQPNKKEEKKADDNHWFLCKAQKQFLVHL